MLGAELLQKGGAQFTVWAPLAKKVELLLFLNNSTRVPMRSLENGYFEITVASAKAGDRYAFSLDGHSPRPDPASRYQPTSVHDSSQIVDPQFPWTDDNWKGIDLKKYVIYEMHVGTFSPEGTFESAIPYLDSLVELGITAVEIMPVSQFPGQRNWGYDGVFPFAAQNSYGGAEGFKKFVDASHARGLAVVLDVVYNHLGPEGNYLHEFGPYFTDRYKTPWGMAVNFDGPGSDHVRRFFLENAEMWLKEFHVDALRIDAVHAIYDFSAVPFLSDLSTLVDQLSEEAGRPMYLIAESDLNDTRLIRDKSKGGLGLDSQWSDDFHHALHTLLTGEKEGYYMDFGSLSLMEKVFREGFAYTGNESRYRGRRHGNKSMDLPPWKFVVSSQNHDQIGNRMKGERLAQLIDFESQKVAAAAVLLSPYIPMLFMGEEWGEPSPFLYFISHSDPDLIRAVQEGRKKEFESFGWRENPPDPFDEKTYLASKIHQDISQREPHRTLRSFYKRLLQIRKNHPALQNMSRESINVKQENGSLLVHYSSTAGSLMMVMNFSLDSRGDSFLPADPMWKKILDSDSADWKGPGDFGRLHGRSVVLFSTISF